MSALPLCYNTCASAPPVPAHSHHRGLTPARRRASRPPPLREKRTLRGEVVSSPGEGEAVDEARLIEKLQRIEALFAGAATAGEQVAAERARQRIMERLQGWAREDPPIEYRFTLGDMWGRKLFVALLRRYGIIPYRYKGQRYTTVMAQVSKRFVDETLWPEFQACSETLQLYLTDVTERVIAQVIHQDSSEAAVVEAPLHLPPGVKPGPEPPA